MPIHPSIWKLAWLLKWLENNEAGKIAYLRHTCFHPPQERTGPPDSLCCAEIFQTWQRGAGVSLKYSVCNMFSSSTPKKTHNAGIASRPSLLRGGSIAALVRGGCLLLDYVPVVAHGHQGHRWWQRKGWRSCRGLCVPSLLMACRYFLSHPCVSSWPLPVG